MSFTGDLNRFRNRSIEVTKETRKAITIELFNSVISDTPVKLGRARGNWQTSEGQPISGVVDRVDPNGSQAMAEVQQNLGEGDTTVFLTNNLPYIEALEEGHSKKHPEGMVRKNVARINRIVQKVARKNRT